jgi:hypothetical protein
MNLFDRHTTNTLLVIDHPHAGTRLIAALWPAGDGLVFADIGWPEHDSAHPFHAVAGPVRYDGFAWHCAPVAGEPVLIRPLFAWEGDLAAAWVRWQAWVGEHPEYGGDAARRAWRGAALGGVDAGAE